MRIVFVSYIQSAGFHEPSQWLTRIEAYIGILEELSKIHEVISIEQINYEGTYAKNGVDYRFLKTKDTLFPSELHSYIYHLHPDIVFVHGMHFPIQVIQLKQKLGKSVKIFVQNHAEKPAQGWIRWLQKLADRSVSGYFFASAEMGLPWLEKKIISDRNKIHEVMEASSVFQPMDRVQARKITGIDGPCTFIWVGRLDANKDPLTVIDAFSKFLPHQPDARMFMFFHTEELRKEIENRIAPFQNNIRLLGKIPHAELQPWFNSSDFIISASHYEGSGVAVCEGMSCGCIPLVTNIPSFRMMTGHGKSGRLYEAGRADELLQLLMETQSMNIEVERKKVLQQFDSVLSFKAISEKINQVLTYC